MMPATLSIASTAMLVIFLIRFWKNSAPTETATPYHAVLDLEESACCPEELVSRIFSREDADFVAQLNSKPLRAFFLSERKMVARQWVRDTAGSVRRIMREHVSIARSSQDLEIHTELKLYLEYGALEAACALLAVALELSGPVQVRRLSLQVYRLAENLSDAHSALKAAAEARQAEPVYRG